MALPRPFVFDAHVRVLPYSLREKMKPLLGKLDPSLSWLRGVWPPNALDWKTLLRMGTPTLRFLPPAWRQAMDQFQWLGRWFPPLLQGDVGSLLDAMKVAGVQGALIYNLPPLSDSSFIIHATQATPVLEACFTVRLDKQLVFPTRKQLKTLCHYRKTRALLLCFSEQNFMVPQVAGAVEQWVKFIVSSFRLPILLYSPFVKFYKSQMDIIQYLLKTFPDHPFLMCHMNGDDPLAAMDLAHKFPNLFLTTGMQPPEVIFEAARKVGAHRILFASDWPHPGLDPSMGADDILSLAGRSLLSFQEVEAILGGNARRLLGLREEAGGP